MSDADPARYRDLLGADGFVQHAPIQLAGCRLETTLRPRDGETLAALLARLSADRQGVVIRGGGSRVESANHARAATAVLSTDRLAGVAEFDPSEGVCRVGAGTKLRELRATVNEAGWEVPLAPPGPEATVGGVIAAAAIGPRTLAFGPPRRAVLGLDVALANGERTKWGGRVVKNVTGFDMAKLYTGSFGSLGVIEAAWLRLRPLARRRRCFVRSDRDAQALHALALAAARRDSAAAAAVCTTASQANGTLAVEFAGDAASVARDSDWLLEDGGAEEVASELVAELCNRQAELPGAFGLRFRISVLPSRAAELHARLHADGAETLGYPGLNVVYAGFALSDPASPQQAAAAFEAARRAASDAAGHAVCESAPDAVRAEHDMFGDVSRHAALFEALKAGFDPERVLNPGLFAGRL